MDSKTSISPESLTTTNDEPADGRPYTIPALKEWVPGPTTYVFNAQARIVLDRRAVSQLHATAVVFIADLQRLSGIQVPLTIGSKLQAGDIFLTLDAGATTPGPDGYLFEVGST